MRKTLFIFVATLCLCLNAFGATYVQSDAASFDPYGTSRSVTFSSATGTGVLIVGFYHGGSEVLTCSDNKSGSYTTVATGGNASICAAYNVSGGATHTVTFALGASSTGPGRIFIAEYSGAATVSAFDQQCTESDFTSNISCTTGVTGQDNELVFAGGSISGGGTAGSGFTVRETLSTNTMIEDKNVVAAGAQTCSFTNAEATAAILCATFKDAGGAPACTPTLTLLGAGKKC